MDVGGDAAVVLDDGAGVDDGVGGDGGARVDDGAGGDEDGVFDGGFGGDDGGWMADGGPIDGVGEVIEDAAACIEVADAEDGGARRVGAGGEEIVDGAEAFGEIGEGGRGGIVVVAEDGVAGGDGSVADDEGVTAGTDEAEREVSSGHGRFSEGRAMHLVSRVRRHSYHRPMASTSMSTTDDSGIISGRPTRLGCVSYLNTLPLIEGLGKLRDVRLTLTAPSRLIDLLEEDEADLALVSVIDYQRSGMDLVMVPSGMIGCDGPTMTVRLFSRVPIEGVETIHADADSHTSVTLARMLVAERRGDGRVPEVVEFDVDEHRARLVDAAEHASEPEWPEALLLIGDKVVTDSPPAMLYPHQLDLGEAWQAWTGLPFVYAVWMCRAERAGDPMIATGSAVLDRQRRHNATRLAWIVASRAPVRGWPRDLAEEYLSRRLRYEVTAAHRESIERFFDEAHGLGLIERRRPTRWLDRG